MPVKPYVRRVKDWKVRNMIMLYLEARDSFLNNRRLPGRRSRRPFDRMREICDTLFQVKEDHHLLYRRIVDPKKKKFAEENKYTPDDIELDFMNNIGLLFHKMLVARELQYVLEHYLEESDTFRRTNESLENQLAAIEMLFDDGIRILKELIRRHKDNTLLLTLLLENPDLVKRHFGANARTIIEEFMTNGGLDDIYVSVGGFYLKCGRKENAIKMFKAALKHNVNHAQARSLLSELQTTN